MRYSSYTEKFATLAKRYGFRIRKVPFANDILSVQYRNHHIMTIPKRMYGEPNLFYRDRFNHVHPHYYEREHRLKNWNFLIKRAGHIDKYEREFTAL